MSFWNDNGKEIVNGICDFRRGIFWLILLRFCGDYFRNWWLCLFKWLYSRLTIGWSDVVFSVWPIICERSVFGICGGSAIVVSNDIGAKVVTISDIVGCFSMGLEIVPKGMDTEGVRVGWRGVDDIVLTV